IGTEESAGGVLLGWMGPLHFGNFQGLLSKVIWFALGIAMAYVTLTGLQLWVQRRREAPVWAFFSRMITTFGYGTATAMAGAGIGFFLALPLGAAIAWTAWGFILTSALCLAIGAVVLDEDRLGDIMKGLLGLSLVSLPIFRLLAGGDGWPALLTDGQTTVVGMDLAVLKGGGFVLAAMAWQRLRVPVADEAPTPTPAE
ncbi:MAG: PepSY-associated TM helix domain-containing protein, partial [Pseudomonadota bacterium]